MLAVPAAALTIGCERFIRLVLLSLTRFRSTLVFSVLLVLVLVALPATALAHERRTIAGGKYDVVVGWDVEPAYEGQKNGASIRISQAGSTPAVPVEGADKTLKVQIRQGAQTKEFALRAVFGQAGYYVSDILPSRAGDYVWTFVGSINADPVNEKFDTADGKFDKVASPTSLEFPIPLPDPAQTAATIQATQSDAQTTRLLAYAGIGVAILALIAGLAGWLTRPRVTTASRTAPPVRSGVEARAE
jgi:hypothetical protein